MCEYRTLSNFFGLFNNKVADILGQGDGSVLKLYPQHANRALFTGVGFWIMVE